MQTATFVLESRSDPVSYGLGINETAFVIFRSKPAAIIMATASSPQISTHWLWHAAGTTGPPTGKVGAQLDDLGLSPALYFSYVDADGVNRKASLLGLTNFVFIFNDDALTQWFQIVQAGPPTDTGTAVRIPVSTYSGLEPPEGTSLRLGIPAPGGAGPILAMKISVSNAGAMQYTPDEVTVRSDPGRFPISTRNVQRRTNGEFVVGINKIAAVTLLLRAETRYIKFGGWGDPWGDGIMALYSASNQWSYSVIPGGTGLSAVGSSLSSMSGRLADPLFTTVEGQVIIGSGRGGGPGSFQVKTGNQEVSLWHNPCRIEMTSANGAKWKITPGAGGALTPAPA